MKNPVVGIFQIIKFVKIIKAFNIFSYLKGKKSTSKNICNSR